MTSKQWEKFEKAVARFIEALDPNAKVSHDIDIPDKDTGEPRQKDVWIDAKVAGHYPVSVLVSCKRWKRKLSKQDIDAFIGELDSSGAHKGVIYSYSGFTKPAIKKSNVRGISCCRLYENQPPDIPDSIIFSAYCSQSRVKINVSDDLLELFSDKKWSYIFNLETETSGRIQTVLDDLVEAYKEMEKTSLKEVKEGNSFPQNYNAKIIVPSEHNDSDTHIYLTLYWEFYKGKVEAYLIDGSYSVTENKFKGKQIIPSIDRLGETPGKGWELLENPPENIKPPLINAIKYNTNIKRSLLEYLSHRKLSDFEYK